MFAALVVVAIILVIVFSTKRREAQEQFKVFDLIDGRGVNGTCATMVNAIESQKFHIPHPEIRERDATVEEAERIRQERRACRRRHSFPPAFGTRGSGPQRVRCTRWACDAEREVSL